MIKLSFSFQYMVQMWINAIAVGMKIRAFYISNFIDENLTERIWNIVSKLWLDLLRDRLTESSGLTEFIFLSEFRGSSVSCI